VNREEFASWETLTVRWSDMDALGHVNNAKYFTYLESARIRLFSELGTAPPGSTPGHGFALVAATCNFRRQIHFPAQIHIGTRIMKIGNSSFHLEHVFLLGDSDNPAADAASVVVWTDYTANRSAPLPGDIRARLEALQQGQPTL